MITSPNWPLDFICYISIKMWNSARGTAILRLHVQCKSALPNHASHYTGDISEGLLSRSLPELLCNEITLKLNLLNRMSAGNSPGDISTCVFYVDVIYCILICCVFTINCSDRNLSRTFFLHSCLLFYFFFGMVSHCLSWHKHVDQHVSVFPFGKRGH